MEIRDSPLDNYRNWLELPPDVTLMILMKLQQLELLESVQFVCKPWYDLCKEPSIWIAMRFNDLEKPNSLLRALSGLFGKPKLTAPFNASNMVFNHEKMVYNAVDRSAGRLIDLDIEGFVPSGLFSYIVSRSTQLKRLRLPHCCNISPKAMIEALEKLSSLKELEISLRPFAPEVIVSIINSCPSLTTFKLNEWGSRKRNWSSDKVALAIAKTMPELQHLQLIGNNLTNLGLTAILKGCSRLYSLDLRACFHLDLDGDLKNRLANQIKNLRCPVDPIDDYDYPTTDSDSDDYDCDYGHDDYDFNDYDDHVGYNSDSDGYYCDYDDFEYDRYANHICYSGYDYED